MGETLTIILTPCWKEKSFPDLLPVAPPEFQSRLKNFLFYSTCPPNRKNFYFLRSLIFTCSWCSARSLVKENVFAHVIPFFFLEAPPSFGLPPNVGLFYKIYFSQNFPWPSFWPFGPIFEKRHFYVLFLCKCFISLTRAAYSLCFYYLQEEDDFSRLRAFNAIGSFLQQNLWRK